MNLKPLSLLSFVFASSLVACANNPSSIGVSIDAQTGKKQDSSAELSDASGVSEEASNTTDASPADVMSFPDAPSCTGTTLKLRIMAANLTSGNGQNWDLGHGLRILKGLHPDVTLMQEFNYKTNSEADYQELLTNTFGTGYSYTKGTGDIPNAIVSKYPIKESGHFLDPVALNRDFSWARIALPGGHDLWAVSCHLHTSDNRVPSANAIKSFLTSKNIPATDYVTVGGDFNTSSRSDDPLAELSAITNTSAPYPEGPVAAAQSGGIPGGTGASRKKPLDWVLVSPNLHDKSTPLVMASGQSYAGGLVFDSRAYTPLSDVPGVLATDSAASNMQHMGVVRDFSLSCITP